MLRIIVVHQILELGRVEEQLRGWVDFHATFANDSEYANYDAPSLVPCTGLT
jgi:hypothetical protein